MGVNHFAALPVLAYAIVAFMAGLAYYLLSQALIQLRGKDSVLAKAVGKDVKGLISAGLYFVAIFCRVFLSHGGVCYFRRRGNYVVDS